MGRHKKETFACDEDHIADIVHQLFDIEYDSSGEMKFVRNGNRLTLEDYAFLEWWQDGCKTSKPITKVGQEKREMKLLQKIKLKLLKSGYTLEELYDLISVLDKSSRQSAKCIDKVELIDY